MPVTLFHLTVECLKDYLSELNPVQIDHVGLKPSDRDAFLASRLFEMPYTDIPAAKPRFSYLPHQSDAESAGFVTVPENDYWSDEVDYVKTVLHECKHRLMYPQGRDDPRLAGHQAAAMAIPPAAAAIFGLAGKTIVNAVKGDAKMRRRDFLKNVGWMGLTLTGSYALSAPLRQEENEADSFGDAVLPERAMSEKMLLPKPEADMHGIVTPLLNTVLHPFLGDHPKTARRIEQSQKRCAENKITAQRIGMPSFHKMMFGK